ncbi:MAG: DUF86 domain-containing protein [Candidatus Sericytochromatia bacterium]|nr:DUF86 domain-containing protein [Candidatus Sericytochromatia bacterium]
MVDDVVLNKVATIERCVARARAEYFSAPATFGQDVTRQDAAILNIQRACEASLDLGHHVIRRDRLGVPQGARDVFELLRQAGRLPDELALALKKMVGFRNVAVHDYQALHLPIVEAVIAHHLGDFERFTACMLRSRGKEPGPGP